MAIEFYSSIDVNQNDIHTPVIHKLSSAPSSPSPISGQMYYNTSANTMHYHNGTGWQTVGTSSAAGDIESVVAGTGMTGGATSGDATLNVIGGDGITANADDMAITATQTTLTSITNAALVVGRDAHNQINFGTDNQIEFKTNNETAVIIMKASGEVEATTFDGALEGNADTATLATTATHVTVTDNESTAENNLITFIEDASATGNVGLESDGDFHYNPSSGTVSATIFKGNIDAVDGDFDGTLEADAITIGGTNVVSGSLITTLGTVSAGVWNGTAIENDYLDADTMHLSEAQTVTGVKTIGTNVKLQFRDSGLYLNSSTDGQLDLAADTVFEVTAPTTNISASTTVDITSPEVQIISGTSAKPVLTLHNSNADANSAELKFNKDTASGADNDVMGLISFYGTDAAENAEQQLAKIDAIITDSAHGSEAASLRFYVAENDGTNTLGLTIAGQADDDGEVDVTIGAGAGSTTTIAGNLQVNGTTTTVNQTIVENTVSVLVFEGANDDAHETTLKVVEPTADCTFSLPTLTAGNFFLPAIADTATDASAAVTAAEFALLDGGSTVATGAFANGDGLLHNDGGTMKQTNVSSLATLLAGSGLTATNSVIAVDTLNQDTTGTASLAVVTDSTANTDFPVVFHDESNALLDDTAAFEYNPSSGTLIVANLDIGTDVDVDGTLETDALTIAGTAIVAQATASAVGGVELATAAEVLTGTDAARVVTADTLSAKSVVGIIDVSSLTDALTVTIPHNLGTADVIVQMYDTVTEANVYADIARTTDDMSTASTSSISIDFGAAAPPNDIRVLITSLAGASASGTVAYT